MLPSEKPQFALKPKIIRVCLGGSTEASLLVLLNGGAQNSLGAAQGAAALTPNPLTSFS